MNSDQRNSGSVAAKWNPVLAVMTFLLACALHGLAFLRVAPHRLTAGEPVFFSSLVQYPVWGIGFLVAALLLASFFRPGRALLWSALVLSSVLMVGLVWLAGAHASMVAQNQSPIVRTSLGAGFWWALLLLGLINSDAVQRLRLSGTTRTAVAAAVLLAIGLMLAAGWCDDLSIMKEYANRADDYLQIVLRHIQIVLLAMACTLCIGLPAGWLAYRYLRAGKAIFPLLNIIQTIPSIALFGLLMAPLALLALALPSLARAGISGVGLAPAVIALTLYGLLPVARGTLAGLEQVPVSVLDAARGMGMTRLQIFRRVEAPLALPVVLGGVRSATIQAIGLAAITALIGAGGLGSIMFEGLFSSAQDLILLGVIPIVVLGLLADLAFKVLTGFTSAESGLRA